MHVIHAIDSFSLPGEFWFVFWFEFPDYYFFLLQVVLDRIYSKAATKTALDGAEFCFRHYVGLIDVNLDPWQAFNLKDF